MIVSQSDQSNQINELIAKLKHEDYHFRCQAADALGDIGEVRVIEPLIEALGDRDLKDEESRVNRHIVGALIRIGKSAIPLLIEALMRKDDGFKRYWVADALGAIGDKKVVQPLIHALADADSSVCAGAAEALERIGDERAIDALANKLSTLKETDGSVYIAVRDALEHLEKKHRRKRAK
jgi:HEAT repeat protein